jgi:hypothetical protein
LGRRLSVRRSMSYAAGTVILVLAVVAIVVIASTGRARNSKDAGSTFTRVTNATADDPMRTITPYQLAWMHLYLSPEQANPHTSAANAVNVVERAGIRDNGGRVLETVLARCSMTPKPVTGVRLPWANLPCWVVSIKPGTIEVKPMHGPDRRSRTVKLTVEIAMVDANTGKLMFESSGTPPKYAP